MIGYIPGSGWPDLDGVETLKRAHYYESHNMSTVTQSIRAQEHLILTAAVGALREDIPIGTVYALKDTVTAFMPPVLCGSQFVDLSRLFEEIPGLPTVTHVFMPGSHYETPADKRLLANFADVVGMSITPEAVYAKSLGIKVYALVVVTNSPFAEHSHEKVLQAAQAADLRGALNKVMEAINAQS